MVINPELNSDEYSFDIEWLSAEKLQFKLLTLITVLADNHLAYRGTLSDVCAFLGLASRNSRTNAKIKTAIDCLVSDGFIHALKDGNIWTLTLTKSAKRRSKVIRIKKEWYEVARNYKNSENSIDWSVVLKVWLYLIDNRKEVITSQEIADTLGVSVSVVSRAKSALMHDIKAITSKKVNVCKENSEGNITFRCLGSDVTVTAWIG